jgi:hypothetical protein
VWVLSRSRLVLLHLRGLRTIGRVLVTVIAVTARDTSLTTTRVTITNILELLISTKTSRDVPDAIASVIAKTRRHRRSRVRKTRESFTNAAIARANIHLPANLNISVLCQFFSPFPSSLLARWKRSADSPTKSGARDASASLFPPRPSLPSRPSPTVRLRLKRALTAKFLIRTTLTVMLL